MNQSAPYDDPLELRIAEPQWWTRAAYFFVGLPGLASVGTFVSPVGAPGQWLAPGLLAFFTMFLGLWVVVIRPRGQWLRLSRDGLASIEPDGVVVERGWELFEKVLDESKAVTFHLRDGGRIVVPQSVVPEDRRQISDRIPRGLPYLSGKSPTEQRRSFAWRTVVIWVSLLALFIVIYKLVSEQ